MEDSIVIIVIAQVLGLISWLLLLYSYTKEDIDKLLFLQIFVAVFDVASYLLLGADAGMLICLIELIKSILYYKTDKDKMIFWFGIIFYFIIGLLTIDHWYACLPVIASLIDSYGTARDSKSANIASIISNILWVVYDLIILSYIGAVTDAIVIVCNISVLVLGYSRLLKISKFRIIKCYYLNRKTIDKIYNLDLKNYGNNNIWDKDYQMDVYKKNNDSLLEIKYKHDFVGYINYLNITFDLYENLKRKRTMPSKIDLDNIIEFKRNKKSYIVIESVNIEEKYEKDQAIELIDKKIKFFLRIKNSRKIYIHGIIAYAYTDFEKQLYEYIGFNRLKELDDNIILYEMEVDNIKKIINKIDIEKTIQQGDDNNGV